MPTLTLTVAKVDPPRPNGGKKSKIVGVGGEAIYAYPDKAAKFTPGRSYEIDYSTSDYNGKTFNNLESFHELEGAAATTAATAAFATAGAKDEQIFVVALLKSLIEAGEIKNDKQQLWEATQMLRGLYKHTFGFAVFTPSQAGQRQVA